MKTKDFWYDLPEELIAQTPLEKRDTSRLCVLNRETGEVTHKHFYDVLDYLHPGDCLVMNASMFLTVHLRTMPISSSTIPTMVPNNSGICNMQEKVTSTSVADRALSA